MADKLDTVSQTEYMKSIESRNYYELLGVPAEATQDEIKAAYKEIARIYHPDSNFFDEIIETDVDPETLKTFQTITAAYNILVNAEKRAKYDETLPKGLKDWEASSEPENTPSSGESFAANPMSSPIPQKNPMPQKNTVRQRQPTFGQMSKGYINPFGDQRVTENERISSVSEMLRLNETVWDKIIRVLFNK